MTLDPATARRIEVMSLRIRLERVAALAFDTACDVDPSNRGAPGSTKARLLFLLAGQDEAGQQEIHRAVRLGRHVYEQTSHVLHGRIDGLALPQVVVQEWSDVVDWLESAGGSA